MNQQRQPRGFTLVEVLVVIVIIAILAAISYPLVGNYIARAKQATCMTKLRSLGVAMETYLQDHNRRMPDIASARPSKDSDVEVIETVLKPYLPGEDAFQCPADTKQFVKTGSSYLWNSTLSGQLASNLSFLNVDGRPQLIPLIADKEGWHPGPKNTNILYADMSASSDLRFVTTP
jgi:prepilin-type N-terminal cleavage/methylation domain-containing protein